MDGCMVKLWGPAGLNATARTLMTGVHPVPDNGLPLTPDRKSVV